MTRCWKSRLTSGLFAALLIVAVVAPGSSRAGTSPDVIQVSRSVGVQAIGDLVITRGYESTNLRDAADVFGEPVKIRRPYREVCEAYFKRGLRLDFVSFGGENRCYFRLLNSGVVRSRYWKVKVGSRVYRVGQPNRRLPRHARFFQGLGYRISTIRGPYGPTGSVYATVGGNNRIRTMTIYVGLAGD